VITNSAGNRARRLFVSWAVSQVETSKLQATNFRRAAAAARISSLDSLAQTAEAARPMEIAQLWEIDL